MQNHIGKNNDGSQWLRTKEALEQFPLGRTLLYSLGDFNGGPLETAEIRQKDKSRGIRLWSRASLEKLIEEGRTKPDSEKLICGLCKNEIPEGEDNGVTHETQEPVCEDCILGEARKGGNQ